MVNVFPRERKSLEERAWDGQSMKASIGIAASARIASGALAPGDPLPVEEDLTVEHGCSKPVVREALRILETEGLLEVRRGIGGGARVRHPSASHSANTIGVYLQIGDATDRG